MAAVVGRTQCFADHRELTTDIEERIDEAAR